MTILIYVLIFSAAFSIICTKLIFGRDMKMNALLILIPMIAIFCFSIIGLFTIIARADGNMMQPIKERKYELITEPIYKKIN